jgi:tRNA A37 threonylcarbamoyladenosine dehydratase
VIECKICFYFVYSIRFYSNKSAFLKGVTRLPDEFSRTQLILGKSAMEKLKSSAVAVFGVGGVGSYAAEALARCGIGGLAVVDDDRICLTNVNRQIIATHRTIGRKKVEVMKERILDVNPQCQVEAYECFYSSQNAGEFDLFKYAYIIDAIDTVSSKLILIERAVNGNIPIISCMGAGNKLNPLMLEVSDISKTSVCPLARVMRKELKARGIYHLKVVYSKEKPISPQEDNETSYKYHCVCPSDSKRNCAVRRQVPGSISFVPPAAGLVIASEVVKDITGIKNI